jgi:hypothetical protein
MLTPAAKYTITQAIVTMCLKLQMVKIQFSQMGINISKQLKSRYTSFSEHKQGVFNQMIQTNEEIR